jgi:hypothetical protein
VSIDLDKLVVEIAERFKEHGMKEHLESLRAYYRARRQRKRANARAKRPPWDEDLVLKWAALWRIPPFEDTYPRLRRGASCRCGAQWKHGGGVFVETVFPEGRVLHCRECHLEWLVLEHKT